MSNEDPKRGNEVIFNGLPSGWRVSQLDRSRRGGDFQGIYLIDAIDRRIVLKVFGPKCGVWRQLMIRVENGLTGRSAPDPVSRYRTEKRALDIWRQNGFDVFRTPENVPPLDIPVPYLAFEYVGGPTLKNYFRDVHVDFDAKLALLKRFIPLWGHRHSVAEQQANRHLIQEHASFKHVLLADDGRLVTFDFEEIFTERHPLAFLIGREIAGYLRSLYRVTAPADFDRCLDLVIRLYHPPEFLFYPYRYFFRHPNLLLRRFYALMRQLPANRRHNSRYSVIRLLQTRLGQKI